MGGWAVADERNHGADLNLHQRHDDQMHMIIYSSPCSMVDVFLRFISKLNCCLCVYHHILWLYQHAWFLYCVGLG